MEYSQQPFPITLTKQYRRFRERETIWKKDRKKEIKKQRNKESGDEWKVFEVYVFKLPIIYNYVNDENHSNCEGISAFNKKNIISHNSVNSLTYLYKSK